MSLNVQVLSDTRNRQASLGKLFFKIEIGLIGSLSVLALGQAASSIAAVVVQFLGL